MAVRKHRLFFPSPETADPFGLVTVTDSLSAELLLEAYSRGIFPWSEDPVRWFSPDPRAVFLPDTIRIPKKITKWIRKSQFSVTFDTSFEQVIQACADAHRQDGEWISTGFVHFFSEFHRLGYAHSVEVWQGSDLVGGLYGVQIGAMFAGESMFYRVSNASKVAFAALVDHLEHAGVVLFDAQVINMHTARLGAVLVRRRDFLKVLDRAVRMPALYAGARWPASAIPNKP